MGSPRRLRLDDDFPPGHRLDAALRRADPRELAEAPSAEADDAAVVRRVLDGEEDAFGELVHRYSRRAFWIAWHVLGAVEDARDVVQESFLRLHRSLHRYDFARSFYTWFYRIVMNLAIDALRRRRSAKAVAVEDLGDEIAPNERPSQALERDEERSQVWRVLDALDPKFRAVLVLRDIHGLSSREIAPILGVTHVTARWRLHRGRQLFRDAWARLDEPSSGAAEADKGVS
ncbi:MAG: sigma-70 family RNA polymerase sigma factor [Planctomycetota bacterium]